METRTQNPKGRDVLVKDSLLEKYFLDSLQDIYWAENQIVKAIPKMQDATTTEKLRSSLQAHLNVTQMQVTRLEEIFGLLGEKAEGKKCEAMKGLIDEGESIIKETEEGSATRDVAIIMAAQKIEHYEIATYGGLATLARTIGQDRVAQLLETTLKEEYEADRLLTEIAENDINYQATHE